MLEARDLWVHTPGAAAPAVRGVSFRVGGGEWLAVTGPNGSGKSSLALAAAGLWPARRGVVLAHGVPLAATPAARVAAGLAAVLQEPSSQLFERTVADEMGFAARNLGLEARAIDARVAALADRFGLAGAMARVPDELSAGEQQRVLLAAALATEPRILVVDEGTAHLDASARALALDVIRECVRRGTSVLWVTQDPVELDAADRVIRLAAGAQSESARAPRGRTDAGATTPAPPRLAPAAATDSPPAYRVRIDRAAPADGPRVACSRPEGERGDDEGAQGGAAIEFELGPGPPLALVGPNGAGKSVTLEAIAGIGAAPQVCVTPLPGVRGVPVLVAQFPELQIFGDTVHEEIAFGVERRGGRPGDALDKALELLGELELEPEIMNRSPWDLSTGERRLIQLIAALSAPASLVLLDEPTCGIDPDRCEALARVIAGESGRVGVVLATQDRVLTSRLGARILRLGG